ETAASTRRAAASAGVCGGRRPRVGLEPVARTLRRSRYAGLDRCAEGFADIVIVGNGQNDAGANGGLERQSGARQPSGMNQHPCRGAFVEAVALKVTGA